MDITKNSEYNTPMARQTQLYLDKSLKPRKQHGGDFVKGHRKMARPITTKSPMHIVLRSHRARGVYNMLSASNRRCIEATSCGREKPRENPRLRQRGQSPAHHGPKRAGFHRLLAHIHRHGGPHLLKKGKPKAVLGKTSLHPHYHLGQRPAYYGALHPH